MGARHTPGVAVLPTGERVPYRAYLRSREWADLRERYRRRRRWLCASCFDGDDLELHHVTYRRLGHERLDDVVPLCDPCHRALHARLRAARSSSSGQARLVA